VIDLHCHILPGIDDGAGDLSISLDMARAFVADGVTHVACTPHILPGLYHNSGPQIRDAVRQLQGVLAAEGIALQLVPGADNHVVPDFVAGLASGHLLTLADTRYVLVEPPHHVPPPRLEEFFFGILAAGYVPILTHPERLSWIGGHYDAVRRLAGAGVWMQITAGSLSGAFGRNARYWAERMLDEGHVRILATDAHDTRRRPPNLSEGRDLAAARVGAREAEHLVVTRPMGVLGDVAPSGLPAPEADRSPDAAYGIAGIGVGGRPDGLRSLSRRLRRFFG
jgi:protein-tyrosine phosphatase